MRSCPFCAEDVQDAAIVCKHCQHVLGSAARTTPPPIPRPPAVGRGVKRFALIAFGGIVLFAAIGLILAPSTRTTGTTSLRPTGSSDTEPVASSEPEEPYMTAHELYAAYEANEVAADRQFKGKRIRVSGRIDRIAKDIMDTPFVTLESDGSIFSVQAMFKRNRDENAIAALATREQIAMSCEVSGKLGNVILRDCRIIR
jgi:hypothetical protein